MANIPVDGTTFSVFGGVPTWFFFYRGERLGRATGWHGLAQLESAVAATRDRIRAAKAVSAKGPAQVDGTNPDESSTD